MKKFFLCLIHLIISLFISGCVRPYTVVYDDLKGYREYPNLYGGTDYNGNLELFPQKIEESLTVNEYKFEKYSSGGVKAVEAYHIILDVVYTKEKYQEEIKRITNWSREYKYKKEVGRAGFLFDAECMYFNYPTYIASYNALYSYEYALLVEENRIIYIFLRQSKENQIQIQEDYLPKNYYEELQSGKIMGEDGHLGYSVYYNFSMYFYKHDNIWGI